MEDKRYWKRIWVRRLIKFRNAEDILKIGGYDKGFNS